MNCKKRINANIYFMLIKFLFWMSQTIERVIALNKIGVAIKKYWYVDDITCIGGKTKSTTAKNNE